MLRVLLGEPFRFFSQSWPAKPDHLFNLPKYYGTKIQIFSGGDFCRRIKMVTQLEAWPELTKDEPLEHDLPICDSHHHLWDYVDSFPKNRVRESARPIRHYLLNTC